MTKTLLLLAAITAVLGSGPAHSAASEPRQRIEISTGWKLKALEPCDALDATTLAQAASGDYQEGWFKVSHMPAMVPDILLERGVIEEPWLPGRAREYQWIAERDWVYAAPFCASAPETESWLQFKGLDTIVDVYLNGERIASHANMFLPLAVSVTGRLRRDNWLVLHFHSVFEGDGKQRRIVRDFRGDPVRRPQNNYGTYLGPNPGFSRVGVFDKIHLDVTGGNALTKVVAGGLLDEALTTGTVTLDVKGVSKEEAVELRARLLDPKGRAVARKNAALQTNGGRFAAQVNLGVSRPQVWWPRGYGDQPLYRLETTLVIGDRPHQTEIRTIGFRRITMPKRLHFVVNGMPVRLWGGDWVSPHWQTAVWDQPRAEKLFAMAEHANFNAFRVWGVVEAPDDRFYEMADARGFLLWQDFTSLPLSADARSREICREEATLLLERLKHHPSIFAWCGGNENAMWHDPEFNAQLEDRGPWPGLAAAADVGTICRQMDPERYYQPSTPFYGIDPNDPREGNTHGYTNLWFVPGYDYLNFASEDTRIAAPVLHSLRRFMAPEDLWPDDYSPVYTHGQILPWPESWQKYTTGSSWKKTGPVHLFYDASDTSSLVQRLGMAESLYYQDTIERQRRGRAAADPSAERACGGYLVWKFNDSWPQIYSGKVDYFLEPYHAYYAIRRAYAPVLLSFDVGTYIYLWVVNDTTQPISATARIQLFHLDQNKTRKEIVKPVTVGPGQSQVVVRLDEAGIGAFRREHILHATLVNGAGEVLASADSLGDIERRVTFPPAKLDVRIFNGALVLTTDKFAHTVTLEGNANGDAFGWFFDDNYFDLMPGEEKIVRVLGHHPRGCITAKAWYSPHATTVDWQRSATGEEQQSKVGQK
ncbi:MAG: glycosyl hydrolase 2 galactose-binding domain-containing protein [Planctomycetota bacterium]